MHVAKCIIEWSLREELWEPGPNPLDWDSGDERFGQERNLTRVEIPGTNEEGRLWSDQLKARHGRRQLAPTQAEGGGERSPVQEAAGRRLRSITVAMRIEPEDRTPGGHQTTEGPDRRIAVATQNHRKPAGSPGGTDRRGEA